MTNNPQPADAGIANGKSDPPPGRAAGGRRGASVSTTATRRQVADRLRQRREREEELVVAAADGLARRAAALHEANEAGESAGAAIAALQAMGFTLEDLAEVLQVTVDELGSRTGPEVSHGRRRPGEGQRAAGPALTHGGPGNA